MKYVSCIKCWVIFCNSITSNVTTWIFKTDLTIRCLTGYCDGPLNHNTCQEWYTYFAFPSVRDMCQTWGGNQICQTEMLKFYREMYKVSDNCRDMFCEHWLRCLVLRSDIAGFDPYSSRLLKLNKNVSVPIIQTLILVNKAHTFPQILIISS